MFGLCKFTSQRCHLIREKTLLPDPFPTELNTFLCPGCESVWINHRDYNDTCFSCEIDPVEMNVKLAK
jgi:hypothetical protein